MAFLRPLVLGLRVYTTTLHCFLILIIIVAIFLKYINVLTSLLCEYIAFHCVVDVSTFI